LEMEAATKSTKAEGEGPLAQYPVFQYLSFPLIAAHRGGGATFGPENIMYTIRKSVEEAKVPIIEIDIQRSTDGVLLLSHDDKRFFGQISKMTWDQLSHVDAAWDWSCDGVSFPLRGKGHKLTLLQEVFEEWSAKFPNLVFYLDIKASGVVQQVLDLVNKYDLSNRIIFGAVSGAHNEEMMKLKPKHVPSSSSAVDVLGLCKDYAFGWLDQTLLTFPHIVVGFPLGHWGCKNLLPQGLVDLCHKHGKQVWVFGPGCDHLEIQNLAWDSGVDAIFCDIPDFGLKNLTERQKNQIK